MKAVYRQHAWLVAVFVTTVAVIGAALSVIDFGNLRYFNAILLTLTWGAWMADYIEARPILYRRQRRLRLAFSTLLASGMYGSLNAAIAPDGDPTLRVILVAISGGILLTSILFHADDDYDIPEDVVYPWERWIFKRLR